MILNCHGSLGDQIILTGIPEAYYKLYGEKTYVNMVRTEIWDDNPYLTNEKSGIEFTYNFNVYPKDYMIYYPVRIFYDLTGHIVESSFVRPKIYKSFHRDKICVVNDQAGWPTRTGYRYLNDLITQIKDLGYVITYLRNELFRDCIGNCPPEQITKWDHKLVNIPLSNRIEVIGSCQLYVGYNSGNAQLAGALDTPYIQIEGSVSPINTRHPSCIYVTDIPGCKRCCSDSCHMNCLSNLDNINHKIINVIKEHDDLL